MQHSAFMKFLLLVIYHLSTATPTPFGFPNDHPTIINSASHPITYLHPSNPTLSNPANTKRRIFRQFPVNGWMVHYRVFTVFPKSQQTVDSLTYFWVLLVSEALSMGEEKFNEAIKTFYMGDLRLEVFAAEGVVPQNLIVGLAEAMLEYSMRGFCGMFNARVAIEDRERVFWVTFGVAGR